MRPSQNPHLRHPEKQTPLSHKPLLKKPPWIRVKSPNNKQYHDTLTIVQSLGLHTVCQEASCPNIGECWGKQHVTMMIMGSTCTRACSFCNVKTGIPKPLNPMEPYSVAGAVQKLNLKHVVITSVDRDDLPDGGAQHFAQTILAIRKLCPQTTIEVLTPDFLRKDSAPDIIFRAKPDVFNHNLETVPRLYKAVRPGARYFTSLKLLDTAKAQNQDLFTKSGLMVGLGETETEILQVMDDLRAAQVDFLTIGQYLQPTPNHYPLHAFIEPQTFEKLKTMAYGKGFLMVASSPLTRSSYHADEDFFTLRKKRRRAQHGNTKL